jgi:hypothetical protein
MTARPITADRHSPRRREIGHYACVAGTIDDSLRALAGRFVDSTAAWQQYFDYSIDSGDALDRFIDVMVDTGDPVSDLLLMGMGAYLGETFIRNLGGSWAAMPSGPTPNDPGIQWKDLGVLPFEKVRKRVALGPTHSLGFFLRETADSAALSSDDRTGRWRRFRRGER